MSFKVDLPVSLNIFAVSIGTPIDTIKYSQDCRSVFSTEDIPPVYGRIIW